ncbi:hypothetical protein MNEG_7027 [Monoraphidium neglectum]|uniref:Uncharacterized protein n=1 Tax=Monoraphidium neglectum TaxID=145388 RepID=A0A0D2MJY3_9CHLO|nr:hypothetical protein MNEG_7027 [Monoraphidium neglectum]KIZ00932.1 hypothetical protein MNEG_7027 [Monoraphidium neglectum]|eukprot:XP_013899951.1 hypothetical protein MNEG_7027 [Monoraphidium neglectum]
MSTAIDLAVELVADLKGEPRPSALAAKDSTQARVSGAVSNLRQRLTDAIPKRGGAQPGAGEAADAGRDLSASPSQRRSGRVASKVE